MNPPRLLTIEDVDRMGARGEFDGLDAKRVELIRGQLREMDPIGIDHANLVDWLMEWSYSVLDRQEFRISIHNPMEVPELNSLPRPDVLWLHRRRTRHRHRVPELRLLIEVADTTVPYDTGQKAQLYAEAGVRDYWVVDIPDRKLHVFRDPSENGFQSREVHSGDALVVPLLVPGVTLSPDELFEVLDLDDSDDSEDEST